MNWKRHSTQIYLWMGPNQCSSINKFKPNAGIGQKGVFSKVSSSKTEQPKSISLEPLNPQDHSNSFGNDPKYITIKDCQKEEALLIPIMYRSKSFLLFDSNKLQFKQCSSVKLILICILFASTKSILKKSLNLG